MSETSSKKRKLSLPLVLAGGVSSLVLALGMSPTFSAFTAQITNGVNTATAGTLIMTETPQTGTPCNSNDATPADNTLGGNNAAACTINLFGPNTPLYPGQTLNTTVTIQNSGTITPTSFTLTPGTCVATAGTPTGGAPLGTACGKFNVKVYLGSSTTTLLNVGIGQQTASGFTTFLDLTTLAPGGTQQYTISLQLDSSANNSFQGINITQPLVWKFQA